MLVPPSEQTFEYAPREVAIKVEPHTQTPNTDQMSLVTSRRNASTPGRQGGTSESGRTETRGSLMLTSSSLMHSSDRKDKRLRRLAASASSTGQNSRGYVRLVLIFDVHAISFLGSLLLCLL